MKTIEDFTHDERKTIDNCADKSYSEMTEDEISLVIDWKAAVAFRDALHSEKMKIMEETAQKTREEQEKRTQLAQDAQRELLERSRKRLESSQ